MQKIYPFKFLDSYERKDKDFFFGRDEEIEALYKMIFETRILLVYGTSGTGKTSLIQCGLANKFESYDWSSLYIRRNDNILYSLDKAVCERTNGKYSPSEQKTFRITDLNAKLTAAYKSALKPIYLIFDQFEELYAIEKNNEEEQKNFIAAIKEILSTELPVKIIISIREEYLGYLYEFEREVPELLRKKLRVEPMNLSKVTTVIKSIGSSPTSNISLEKGFENQIAEKIFHKVNGGKKSLTIELPYLQVFLDNLYMKKSKDESHIKEAVFELKDFNDQEDIGDVLRNFLDEQVMKTAKNLEQSPETIWRILSPFVTLEGTKKPLSAEELYGRFEDEPQQLLNDIIQAFVSARILRFSEKDQRYEIAHDSLAKQVNAKRSDEEIAILEVQRLISSQVSVKQEVREYFTEKQLLFIEPYLEKFKESEEEEKWIAASRANVEEQKRQEYLRKEEELAKARKRLRTVAGLLVFAVIALMVAGYFGWDANDKKNKIQQTLDQLTIAEIERRKSMEAQQAARENERRAQIAMYEALKKSRSNMLQMYESEKKRFINERSLLEKNILSYRQYGAENDVIHAEEKKIAILEKKISELEEKIKELKK